MVLGKELPPVNTVKGIAVCYLTSSYHISAFKFKLVSLISKHRMRYLHHSVKTDNIGKLQLVQNFDVRINSFRWNETKSTYYTSIKTA